MATVSPALTAAVIEALANPSAVAHTDQGDVPATATFRSSRVELDLGNDATVVVYGVDITGRSGLTLHWGDSDRPLVLQSGNTLSVNLEVAESAF